MRTALAALLALLAGLPAEAARLRVPADHPSLTEAVRAARAGDVVVLSPGTYSRGATGEEFPIVLAGRGLEIRGAGTDRTVLHAEGASRLFVFRSGDASRVAGLTLMGGFTESGGGAVLVEDGAPELLRLHFTRNFAELGGDALEIAGGEPRVANCLLEGNGAAGPTVRVLGGAPVLERNTLHGNAGAAFEIHSDASPVLRSTIVSRPGERGGSAVGLRIVTGEGVGAALLESNLFEACFDGTVEISGEAEEVLASLREDARESDGLREGDPLFEDPAAGDFRLRKGSPARMQQDQLGAFGGEEPLTLGPPREKWSRRVQRELGVLGPSVPNPLTHTTRIHFTVKEPGVVDLGVYNVLGQRIRTLHTGDLSAGGHSRVWDGRDDAGEEAPPGIYFVRVTQGGATESRRLVLVR